MKMHGSKRLAALAAFTLAASGLMVSGIAGAQNIPIQNDSFETPVLSSGGLTINGIQDWTSNAPNEGVWYPSSTTYFSVSPPDGNQVGYTNGGEIAQQLSATLVQGTYNLSGFFGKRLDQVTSASTLELWAGGSVVNGNVIGGTQLLSVFADAPNLVPAGTFGSFSGAYTASAGNPFLGMTLSVRIHDVTGPQVIFDNIKLSYTSPQTVPEPAFYQMSALLALGGWGLVRMRRRPV